MRQLLFWVVFNVPLGPLAPWVLGLALRRRPHRVVEMDREWADVEHRR